MTQLKELIIDSTFTDFEKELEPPINAELIENNTVFI